VECPAAGADADCAGDKYEACILSTQCGGVTCESKQQLQLSSFLHCFEYEHTSSMEYADSCASAAGFALSEIKACVDSPAAKAKAWADLQATVAAELPTIKCFPWIEVDGSVESKDYSHGCFGVDAATTPLLPLICDAAGSHAPAACSGKLGWREWLQQKLS